MLLRLFLSFCALVMLAATAAGQDRPPVSQCQLVAEALPSATFAAFTPEPLTPQLAALDETVTIRFLGHSTFQIETPGGVSIATDFNGWLRTARLPMW